MMKLFRGRKDSGSKSGGAAAAAAPSPPVRTGSSEAAPLLGNSIGSASGASIGGAGAGSSPTMGRPGTAVSMSPGSTIFRVTIPEHVLPGQEFQVYAGSRIVRVRCPPGSEPGQSLQITVPADPTLDTTATSGNSNHTTNSNKAFNGASPASGSNNNNNNNNKDMPPDSPNVQRVPDDGTGGPPAYMVTVPDGVRGGQQFPVTIQGQQLMVTCPPNATPGIRVRIVPPVPPPPPPSDGSESMTNTPGSVGGGGSSALGAPSWGNDAAATSATSQQEMLLQQKQKSRLKPDDESQLFEVTVPEGVKPGRPFALLAGGVRVLVTCPPNAGPGQRIRFKLPLAFTSKRAQDNMSDMAQVKLSYDKDGWMRTIRISDMKFQWVRMDDKGDVDTNQRFDADKSAYVRSLDFRPGTDERVRDGVLSLVPAADAFVESRVKGINGENIATYAEIAEAQTQTFEKKADWFQEKCQMLCVEWNEGHMRINVRRQFLLEDSVDAVMSLSRRDLRKLWRFEFIGELGIDAGGLAREWFQLVSQQIFDPDMGLWQCSESNQMCMQINPASKFISDDYLVYYRFLGRVMGKALFDRQLVAGHMVQYIYKHMLGWPVQFRDIESIDEEYYQNLRQLKQLAKNGEDLSLLCLEFTTTTEVMGVKDDVELIEGGRGKEVDNDNFPEYMEACLKYRLMDLVKPQLKELLLGFFDVLPEPLLTVFDFQELELLMCGLPEIDLEDWKNNTDYSGEFDQTGPDYPVCHWFWEAVEEFDQEMKARLLQFVTGTSGVPARGFSVLQGNDGNIRKFTIHGVSVHTCLYPRAHTCFNRIDLPVYETKEDLKERLKLAVTMVTTGFDIE